MTLELQFPSVPDYRASWSPVYFEPITGSGERVTVAVVVQDEEGCEVRRTIRDDVLKALYGSRREHISQMIEFVLDHIRAQTQPRIAASSLPISGFSLGEWYPASSSGARLGVLRQAVYRCSSFASLDEIDLDEDDSTTQETTKNWASEIKAQVLAARPELMSSFNKVVTIYEGRVPARLAFLHKGKAAQFETLRPNSLPVSLRLSRGKIYEMIQVRRRAGLEMGTLILGAPRQDDLTYSPKVLEATQLGIRELTQEAHNDQIVVQVAHSVAEAVEAVLSVAA